MYKPKRIENRGWKASEERVAVIEVRSNKNMNSRFEADLREIDKVAKKKHRLLAHKINDFFKRKRIVENNPRFLMHSK